MKKVLILPFHITTNHQLDYLSEGILGELIYLLSLIPEITVLSRSTSFFLHKNPLPYSQIKERYQAGYVLEGNVVLQEEELWISAQLFKIEEEELLVNIRLPFSLEKWTQELNKIAKEIQQKIQPLSSIISPIKDQSKAREYYQQGLYHWHRYVHKEILQAIYFFKKSIRENKEFALAYAALSDCYTIIGIMGYEVPIQAFEHARYYIQEALKLDKTHAESYVSAALLNLYYGKSYNLAKQNIEQAFLLNKNNVKAHHVSTMYFLLQQDYYQAEKHAQFVLKQDPLGIPYYAMMVRLQWYQFNYTKAINYINMGFHIEEKSLALLELRGMTHLVFDHLELAIEDLEHCLQSNKTDSILYAYLGYAYAKAQLFIQCIEIEQQLRELKTSKNTGIIDYALAIIKLGQGDKKAFFTYLKKAHDSQLGLVIFDLMNNPLFKNIRSDKRYQKMMANEKELFLEEKVFESQIIEIKSHTKESLIVDPQDIYFIQANDNYCTIYWSELSIVKNEILRVSLKELEYQLASYHYIVRCHKSFIVNVSKPVKLEGNSKKSFLTSDNLPINIPVSRAKLSQLKTLL